MSYTRAVQTPPLRLSRSEVFGPEDYPVATERLQLDASVPAHGHDFCELALVVGGTAEHLAPAGRRPLRAGDLISVRPGGWHAYGDVLTLDVINVYLGPELLIADLGWILDYAALTSLLLGPRDPQIRLRGPALTRVVDWLTQLGELGPRSGPIGPLRSRALLGCVLAEVADAAADAGGQVGGPDRRADSALLDGPERTALAAMASDPGHPWTVTELARRAAVSPSHLQHRFAARFRMGPLRWLTRHRAEQMAVRLVRSREPVGQIGRSVGWSDPNYAARRFRAVFAMSPTSYRARFGFSRADERGSHELTAAGSRGATLEGRRRDVGDGDPAAEHNSTGGDRFRLGTIVPGEAGRESKVNS